MKIIITGGAGFIGSNYIRYHLKTFPEDSIINLDILTYAGNLENLSDIKTDSRYRFVKGDIADSDLLSSLIGDGVDMIINFAAESHVDRSIDDPAPFLNTNILGTQVLLESARKHSVNRFVQISTDEVYGSLGPDGFFTEETSLKPNSPYSASKASADLLVRSYNKTFGLNTVITRCSNNYGPYQFPEKLVPLFITNALSDTPLPIYGDGLNVRDWIHVEDHCSGIAAVALRGTSGEIYNIGGNTEMTNMEMTDTILKILEKPDSLKTFVEDRLGHDRRYAIDSSKTMKDLNWKPQHSFETGIKKTVDWYIKNKAWWERVKSGEYRNSG